MLAFIESKTVEGEKIVLGVSHIEAIIEVKPQSEDEPNTCVICFRSGEELVVEDTLGNLMGPFRVASANSTPG